MLQHYVLIKYRETTPVGHVEAFCARMLALPSMLGGIERLEIGRDQLHDARSWDLILIMQFQSVAALRGYQQHPEHRAVMQFNDPHVAQIASVDFESPSTVPIARPSLPVGGDGDGHAGGLDPDRHAERRLSQAAVCRDAVTAAPAAGQASAEGSRRPR